MKEIIKEFGKNLKEYVNYLMKVNFKELFVNTGILVCILILSTFVYVPVGLLDDLLFSLLANFIGFSTIASSLFHWFFDLIGFFLALLAFMYMFNNRFKDVKEHEKEEKEKVVVLNNNKENKKVEVELPKKKDN